MSVSDLRTICGPHWDRVKPGQDGWVVKLVDIGFSARIDINGVIGRISISGKFPATLAVDMLHIGMSLDAAFVAYPMLRHIEDVTVSAMTLRRFGTQRPDGIGIEARFRESRLLAFDLERPDAIYAAS
jgi:hypothetical protein